MEFVLFVVVVYILYKLHIFGFIWHLLTKRGNAPNPASHPIDNSAFYEWPSIGNFDFEVVGESNYQSALATLAYKYSDTIDVLPIALLIPEDSNPYDSKAVRVDIDNNTVGYLSRDDARSFRRRLATKKLVGQITKVRADFIGGHMIKGKKASYGVMLDLKPF